MARRYKAGSMSEEIGRELDGETKRKSKPVIVRPDTPTKMWFTISIDDEGRTSVVAQGDKIKCLKYIADYVKENPQSDVDLFIANGAKIVGN